MKVSLNLVKKFINLDGLTVDEIVHRLTFAGVEVESVEQIAYGTNLTVGEVITCEKMPDSDHLHLTTVFTGNHGLLHIVCGAPNVRVGLKVIVALDGAKLPGGITIKKGKIRGYESEGMLCSLLELGVNSKFLKEEQTKGIEELPSDSEVGNDNVLELLGLDDVILDLKLLANRSDLYSVINVAKELETLFGRKANISKSKDPKNKEISFAVNSLTDKCSQFSARVIKGIEVKESPKWIKQALMSSGIRSINNIVDIGNYVMLLTGQPLHMYDLDKLPATELIVRDDYEGDFVALDEKTYKVKKGDIVITSKGKVMCLGGVMGSLECAVDENTKNVVIESANFDFASIRRTSIRLNLSSDSSMRFVKGINPNQYNEVENFTAQLICDLCNAKEIGETNTYLKSKYIKKVVKTTPRYINARLGTLFTDEQIVSALKSAFISISEKDGVLACEIPDWRIDINGEADLSEEVIRILGFENVNSELPSIKLSVGQMEEKLLHKCEVRRFLRGLGLTEQLTYSLVRESEVKQFAILNRETPFKVMNPLTDEHEYVRTNLLPSLMNVLQYNVNHSQEDLSFFEVSDLYSEGNRHIHLGIILSGNDLRQSHLKGEAYSFYHMKGIVDGLLKLYGIEEKRYTYERSNASELHPGKSAMLKLDGKIIAHFGELHPIVASKLGLNKINVIALELDLDALFNTKVSQKKMEITSRFPAVKRDFALIVNNDVSAGQLTQEIKKVSRMLIKNVDIFDVYRGEHINHGHYSIALTVTFSSLEKTLTDSEINALQDQIIETLKSKFGAELRK